jgi:uncharacterized protein
MKVQHNGMLMRIYVAESSRFESRDACGAIVAALSSAGLAGATVFKGIEGFGRHRTLSAERALDAWADLPMLIEVVDDEAKLRAFIPALERVLDEGLVTLERVQTVMYRTPDEDTAS